ncbi:MAG: sulfite exporter TauE/SafE family protein, partial [Mariniphaga sp.]|nr:sulfite exporter TauE/SafE family protein [Mariniphaga sp.]
GTIPMMLLISWIGNLFSVAVRNKMNKIVPYIVVLIGAIFILRGLSLGIPYLSPPAEKMTPAIHMNMSKPEKAANAVKHACCQPDSLASK